MPDIKLPDGSVASFPDSMNDAEIEAVLRARFPAAKQRVRHAVTRPADTLIDIVPPEASIDYFTAPKMPRVLRRAPR